MVEIEVKIRLKDLAETGQQIARLGANLVKERFREDNVFYDSFPPSLTPKQCGLRLRQMGRKTFLTFKAAPQKSRRFKVREEFETEIKNEKAMRHILRCLGLRPIFRYQKFRTIYRKGGLKICLDETAVGNFLELEGERNEIMKVARALGFNRTNLIKKDYVELLRGQEEAP